MGCVLVRMLVRDRVPKPMVIYCALFSAYTSRRLELCVVLCFAVVYVTTHQHFLSPVCFSKVLEYSMGYGRCDRLIASEESPPVLPAGGLSGQRKKPPSN